jgi:hypothetical protein
MSLTTMHNFQEPHSSSDKRPSPPLRMPERPEMPRLEDSRPAPDTSSSLLMLNHSNNGPFMSTTTSIRPYVSSTPIFHPHSYLFPHPLHNMIFPLHRPMGNFQPFPQPHSLLQALPQPQPRSHAPELDRFQLDIEHIREERHSPGASSSVAMSNHFTPTFSLSSYSGSQLPRSMGLSPTRSPAGEGTPPTFTTRKRRRQDEPSQGLQNEAEKQQERPLVGKNTQTTKIRCKYRNARVSESSFNHSISAFKRKRKKMDAKETEIIFEILREPRREVALFSEAQRRNEDLIRQLQEEGLTSDQIERIRDGEDPEDVFKE